MEGTSHFTGKPEGLSAEPGSPLLGMVASVCLAVAHPSLPGLWDTKQFKVLHFLWWPRLQVLSPASQNQDYPHPHLPPSPSLHLKIINEPTEKLLFLGLKGALLLCLAPIRIIQMSILQVQVTPSELQAQSTRPSIDLCSSKSAWLHCPCSQPSPAGYSLFHRACLPGDVAPIPSAMTEGHGMRSPPFFFPAFLSEC